jgi:molybdopterin-guanine dinucleotide biosynthesis protein A
VPARSLSLQTYDLQGAKPSQAFAPKIDLGNSADYDSQIVTDLTAFILAGGKSTRMGSDKAFLSWAEGSLLSHALELVAAVTPNVRIVGASEKFSSFGTVIEDVYRDRGPLGGIHAALSTTPTELNLMLAVDLPLIETRFLQFMIGVAEKTDSVVTVPRADGVSQPLCAIYRQEFAQTAEEALQAGKNKIDPLFAKVKTRIIEEDEFTREGFSVRMFSNLNTPEDWKAHRTRSIPTP